ncbi:MAG: single-stranded-DNA-specific exonuclease RecJ [Candidatus Andersenbacteria bacterium]
MKSSGAPTQTAPVTSSNKAGTLWKHKEVQPSPALVAAVGDPFLATLLSQRGITDPAAADRFLKPTYNALRLFGGAPDTLLGLEKLVGRLLRALQHKEKIVVFGDYDVDGVSGSAALVDALRLLKADVRAVLPHRERDGYGLQLGSLPLLQRHGPQVVVTVDNGIQSHAAVAQLQKSGIDVLIIDHHQPGPELPAAYAIVNPKQAGEGTSDRTLCAGGLVFRVVEALFSKSGVTDGQEKWFLDLAALATVCDMVPLTRDNRLLVHFGLKTMQRTRRLGLRQLIDSSLGREKLSAETIGFRLGPRLNAAGRLEHAQSALELLATQSPLQAVELAGLLDRLNRERQQFTKKVVQEALLAAQAYLHEPALVLTNAEWPKGVVGLAASKLAERFNRPVFVLQEGAECVGSGRSVPGVDLAAAIESMRPLFVKAGGHAAAAGCTISRENLPAFKSGLLSFTRRQRGQTVPPRVREYDGELTLDRVALDFLDLQTQLEPYGMGNPRPVLRLRDCVVDSLRLVGADQRHVSLVLRQGRVTRRAVAFGQADRFAGVGRGAQLDVFAQVRQNDWGGSRSAELQILDTMAQ